MSLRIPLLGIATGAVLMFAAPTSALAVTGTIGKPCYSHIPTQGSEPVVVTLTGGTPGAGFVMAATAPGKGLGSQGSASGDFDAAGNATATINNISPPNGTIGPTKGQPVVISVKDFGTPGPPDVVLGTTLVTNLTVNFASQPRSPRARRAVSVSGTPFAGQPMFGFVVRGTTSRVLRRFSLGTANACGFASRKAVLASKNFKLGSYRLYVNAGNKLVKDKAVYIGFRVSTRFR